MSRASEVEKIETLLVETGEFMARAAHKYAEYLVDSGIRSKDGFEIVGEHSKFDTTEIVAVDYKEDNGHKT